MQPCSNTPQQDECLFTRPGWLNADEGIQSFGSGVLEAETEAESHKKEEKLKRCRGYLSSDPLYTHGCFKNENIFF